jgi:glycerate 2-kinase
VAERAPLGGRSGAIPQTVLVAGGAFSPRLSAARVVAAIERGLREGGRELLDPCPLTGADEGRGQGLSDMLAALRFDARMRSARALVIAERRLQRPTLERTAAFELATRARQAGVPCYAVTAENALNAFDARMLDLQTILTAATPSALAAAGRELARVL